MIPVTPFQFRLDNGPIVANDANGYARFDNVTPGIHIVSELSLAGWNQILVTPQGGQLNVAAGNLCAGIVFKNQKIAQPQSSSASSMSCINCNGGSQNVTINSNSTTSVNSIINASGGNVITIDQNGNIVMNGANAQNAGVNSGANTSVNSTINAVSGNTTNVTQNAGGNPNAGAAIHLIPLTNATQLPGQTQQQTFSINTNFTGSDQQTMMTSIIMWIDQLRQQVLGMFSHS